MGTAQTVHSACVLPAFSSNELLKMNSKSRSPSLPLPLLVSLGLPPGQLRAWAAVAIRALGAPIQINAGRYEVVPAACVQPRKSAACRQRSAAVWALRDRRGGGIVQWLPTAKVQPPRSLGRPLPAQGTRAVRRLQHALGLRNRARRPLPSHAEPSMVQHAGRDRYGRPLWLSNGAGHAWLAMQRAAAREGIRLEAISGFRSVEYQAEIIRRKLKRGLSIEQILAVNAAPGESEHHSGRALDISCPGEPPAEESFELTPAFAWLQARAGHFGFRLSYPRDNPFGIVYEPWHWCWHPPAAGSLRQRGGD